MKRILISLAILLSVVGIGLYAIGSKGHAEIQTALLNGCLEVAPNKGWKNAQAVCACAAEGTAQALETKRTAFSDMLLVIDSSPLQQQFRDKVQACVAKLEPLPTTVSK